MERERAGRKRYREWAGRERKRVKTETERVGRKRETERKESERERDSKERARKRAKGRKRELVDKKHDISVKLMKISHISLRPLKILNNNCLMLYHMYVKSL